MKNNFLEQLILDILSVRKEGVSKVKLAKLFYLTHKWLVQNQLASPNDWKYVRMPLGPVPKHFNSLKSNKMILITAEPTSLSYNMEVYQLVSNNAHVNDIQVDDIVNKLSKFSTSELVEYTHSEPSWLQNYNGNEYTMSSDDISRELPNKLKLDEYSVVEDNQNLQSQLIEGMIDDIVEVSTALEYPEAKS